MHFTSLKNEYCLLASYINNSYKQVLFIILIRVYPLCIRDTTLDPHPIRDETLDPHLIKD